jgi:hypothetical protein
VNTFLGTFIGLLVLAVACLTLAPLWGIGVSKDPRR